MPSQDQWDNTFLNMAVQVSLLSKDPSTKVGSILVTPDNKQISFGYNGFVAGIKETDEMWNDRSLKILHVLHSEENNLLNCNFNTFGCTIYLTHQPCIKCIIKLAQAKIRRIVYINKYEKMGYMDIWNEYAKLFEEVIQKSI